MMYQMAQIQITNILKILVVTKMQFQPSAEEVKKTLRFHCFTFLRALVSTKGKFKTLSYK